jgi:hypothetical protein
LNLKFWRLVLLRIIGYVGGTVLAFAMVGDIATPRILPLAAAGFMFYLAACSVVSGFDHVQRQPDERLGAALARYWQSNRSRVRWFIFMEAIGAAFALVGFRILTMTMSGGTIALIILAAILALPAWLLLRRIRRGLQAHPNVNLRTRRLFTWAVVLVLIFLGLWVLAAIVL